MHVIKKVGFFKEQVIFTLLFFNRTSTLYFSILLSQ